ncbi:MAG: hypothetical protein ABI462_06935 [Ignavibacteria bacterium]
MELSEQVVNLFLLALPIACIAWTITHEELFREPREFCTKRSHSGKTVLQRKFFYIFTCEYCFSHYVAILFLIFTRFHLLFDDWRGYIIGGFALVWIANIYMSIFGLVRVGLKKEKMDADIEEIKLMEEKKKIN